MAEQNILLLKTNLLLNQANVEALFLTKMAPKVPFGTDQKERSFSLFFFLFFSFFG